MSILRIAATRAFGRGKICDPLPDGRPISPSQYEEVRPAIFKEDQIGRITNCAFGREVESELTELVATKVMSGPPTAIEFSNAAVFGGQILSNGKRYLLSNTSPYSAALGPIQKMDALTVPQSQTGCTVFGHWLMDDCATRELSSVRTQTTAITRPNWVDCTFYEDMFQQSWDEVPAFVTPHLTLLKELSFSKDKAARHMRLRRRVREKLKATPGEIVYLARGKTGNKRTIANEAELLQHLEAAGVCIIQCEADVGAMYKRCLDARIILGIEGSQLCHAIYLLGQHGAVLAIQPPHRFCNAHHHWSRQLGMQYGTVIGKNVEGGWIADPDEVLGMIELLLKATA